MSANDQQQVQDFLQTGAAFSGQSADGQEVRRIDTHCASIFLSGDRAWKIKRAVRFPYLDFSTPDLRHEALAKELELNRRTAPDLYLGLHVITLEPSGELALDGGGSPVDWVLEMRRFPDGALLSQLADRHALSLDLLQGLTDEIAAFHACAEVVSQPDGFERLAAVIEMNIASLEAYPICWVRRTWAWYRRLCGPLLSLISNWYAIGLPQAGCATFMAIFIWRISR